MEKKRIPILQEIPEFGLVAETKRPPKIRRGATLSRRLKLCAMVVVLCIVFLLFRNGWFSLMEYVGALWWPDTVSQNEKTESFEIPATPSLSGTSRGVGISRTEPYVQVMQEVRTEQDTQLENAETLALYLPSMKSSAKKARQIIQPKSIEKKTGEQKLAQQKKIEPKSTQQKIVNKSMLTEIEKKLLQKNSEHYTIQLFSSESKAKLDQFIQTSGLQGKGYAYQGLRAGKPWYVLIYGDYADIKNAKKSLALLPPKLLKQNPWVRQYSFVQESIRARQ